MNVNVTCFASGSTGYALAACHLVKALDELGHAPAVWPIGPAEPEPQFHETFRRAEGRRAMFDPAAPSVRVAHQFMLDQHVGGEKVGFPIFELDRFTPLELHHLKAQDRLLVCSKWAKNILADHGFSPGCVDVVPLGVDPAAFRPAEPTRGGPTVFLSVGKWEYRKGHDFVLRAFEAAFTKEDDVRLVMVSYNPCAPPEYSREWERHYEASPLAGKVVLYKERLPTQADVVGVMRGADVGFFPSRAEGWNLELGEMLAMGKHVVCTDHSAHTEFASGVSHPIAVGDLEWAFDGRWFHGQGRWARLGDDQLEQAVAHLRGLHKRKKEDGWLFNQGGVERMREFTWRGAAERLVGALE